MLYFKSKNISLLLNVCVILGLLFPALTQADEVNTWGGDSGSIDARKAAVQRAAKKQKKAEEKRPLRLKRTLKLKREKRLQNNWYADCIESEIDRTRTLIKIMLMRVELCPFYAYRLKGAPNQGNVNVTFRL